MPGADVILQAASLAAAGVTHGFTTRLGGVSAGPYARLNLSARVGDDPAAVAENRRRFEGHSGLRWRDLVALQQVHGAEVLLVDRPPAELPPVSARCCDASVSDRRDAVLAVRTADCVPLLLYCPRPRAAAAVHAGWRGTLAGVAGRAVVALERSFGCKPADLLAAVGPCIRLEAFEVGAEVYGLFERQLGPAVVRRRGAALHVDLAAANRLGLQRAGLVPEHIEDLGLCTHAGAERFFSHRRDRGRTGRQMAYITLAEA